MTSSAVPREYLKEPFIENVYLTEQKVNYPFLRKASSLSTCGLSINSVCVIRLNRYERSKNLSSHQVLHRPEETNCRWKCSALFEAFYEVWNTYDHYQTINAQLVCHRI